MKTDRTFLLSILNSLHEQLTVLDSRGTIVFVNQSWESFGEENCYNHKAEWIGQNYITVCDGAAKEGDEDAGVVVDGLRKIIDAKTHFFCHEYPCHSREAHRWFLMRAVPFICDDELYVVVTHQDITARKLAEERVALLATQDGLTKIPNRRKFDEFCSNQWQEHIRRQRPMSLAIIDIDHFKRINDNFGHQRGDLALVQLAEILRQFARRPSDLCARYGGEEFVLLLGDTGLAESELVANKLLSEVRSKFNFESPEKEIVKITVSVGLVSTIPWKSSKLGQFVELADQLLYKAKEDGRDRLISGQLVSDQGGYQLSIPKIHAVNIGK